MIAIEDIRTLAENFKTYYETLRIKQNEDLEFYNDAFTVGINKPYHVKRTGTGARIVDSMVERITVSNPKVFREPLRTSETANEAALKVSRFLNRVVQFMISEIEESVKNAALVGEGYWQIEYNDKVKNLPIFFTSPDPLTIFPDPSETNGVPSRVVKMMEVPTSIITRSYPQWGNPQHRKPADKAKYLAYWDEEIRYAEVDGEPIIPIQPNVLRVVPFVHFYSGLGKSGLAASPEDKAVGRLRRIQGRLIEECEIESRLDSIIGLWANPYGVWEHIAEGIVIEGGVKEIDISPGHNIEVPFGIKFTVQQGTAPSPEMFRHLGHIQASLGMDIPPVALGLPSMAGASGRQEDIYSYNYDRKVTKLVKSAERAMSVALGMCLKIVEKMPNALPITQNVVVFKDGDYVNKEETINIEDIDGNYDCTVGFRPDDELIQDRKIMLGRTLLGDIGGGKPRITWLRFMTEHLNMTVEEAQDEINRVMAEMYYQTNPLIADMIAREAIEQMGGRRYLEELDRQGQATAERQRFVTEKGAPQVPTSSGQGRNLATQNPTAREQIRQMLMETPYGVRRQGGQGEGR